MIQSFIEIKFCLDRRMFRLITNFYIPSHVMMHCFKLYSKEQLFSFSPFDVQLVSSVDRELLL